MILRRIIKIPIYAGHLEIIIFNDENELLDKHDFGSANDKVKYWAAWVTEYNNEYKGGGKITVFLRSDASLSVISHEAVHIVNRVFEDRGVMVAYNSDEHYAYFLGWVVNEIYKTFSKFKNKFGSSCNNS